MLVMYTLNQAVSSNLPKTAYIKFIDIWLIFGLCLPFMILILLVIIEHYPEDSVTSLKVSSAVSDGEMEQQRDTLALIKYFTQKLLPILEVTFITCYAVTAFALYLFY